MNRTITVRSLLTVLGYVLLTGAGVVLSIATVMTYAVYFRRPASEFRPPLLD